MQQIKSSNQKLQTSNKITERTLTQRINYLSISVPSCTIQYPAFTDYWATRTDLKYLLKKIAYPCSGGI